MHQKISYEIFSKRGKYHELQGKENEDAINVVTNGDYIFAILSDGAGSGPLPKLSSQCTVDEVGKECLIEPSELFSSNDKLKNLIFNLQSRLNKTAIENNCQLSDMMATLIVVGIDFKNKRYIIIHIGDGLVAKVEDNEWRIVSYPENGYSKNSTYFPNSSNVYSHLRIRFGTFGPNEKFFVGTDGCFEGLYLSDDYVNIVENKNIAVGCDDVSYCYITV